MEQRTPLTTTIKLSSYDEPGRFSHVNPPHPWIRYVVASVAVATVFGVVILALMLAVPISMLAIGTRHRQFWYCPIEPRISRFLIVGGTISLIWILLTIILSLLTIFVAYTRSMTSIIGVLVLSGIIFALQIFSFIWLIVGSVWTFRVKNYVRYFWTDPFNFPWYCDKTLYQFTFAIIIIIYILLAIQVCSRCCVNLSQLRRKK